MHVFCVVCWLAAGLLHAGDRIIEVNGYPVEGLDPEHVIQILVGQASLPTHKYTG